MGTCFRARDWLATAGFWQGSILNPTNPIILNFELDPTLRIALTERILRTKIQEIPIVTELWR